MRCKFQCSRYKNGATEENLERAGDKGKIETLENAALETMTRKAEQRKNRQMTPIGIQIPLTKPRKIQRFDENGEKVDAHSDARGDSISTENDTTLPSGDQPQPATSAELPATAAGLAKIAADWVRLPTPIREAVTGIVADDTGQLVQSGLASIAGAWVRLSPAVKEAILAIVADALSAPTTTVPVAVAASAETPPAFTRGTFAIGELLGGGSDN
ncbi:MAG: hypothetical protein ACRC46_14510 [Thermoguttaceae bacterium]